MNLYYLESVSSFIDTEGNIYPSEFNGVTEVADIECGFPLEALHTDWFNNLSVEDREIINSVTDSMDYVYGE